MTEKLKRVKKDISKKPITIMLLLVMLVFSLVALSFAWYRNYVDIKGTTLTSGKISLEIDGYGVDGQGSVTAVTPIIINGQTESSVVVDSTVTKIDTWNKEYHVYYFIKNPKTDTSIDVDASISISLDNAVIDSKLGGVKVDINQIKTEGMTGKLSDFNGLTEAQIISAISSGSADIEPEADGISFSNLENAYSEFSIPVGEYVCIRLTYTMGGNLSDYSEIDLSIRSTFCIAQKDGLPGAITNSEYVVYTLENLKTVLAKYRPNDKIIVKGNIEYVGDLIINRPLVLDIQNSTVTVRGNLLFAYPYQGRFTIDTSRGGSITVFKQDVEIFDEDGNLEGVIQTGGNMTLVAPLSQIEFIGKNSAKLNFADIYVEGALSVTASMPTDSTIYNQGLIINGCNIRPIAEEKGDTSGYKDINIGEKTKVTIMNYTEVGKIISSAMVVEIENRGTIGGIDLALLEYSPDYIKTKPQILINNYGSLRNTGIKLPINWAEKFVDNGDGTYSGNTRILSQPGAGMMIVSPATNGFISDGSRDPARDHIEYVTLDAYVEKVNGNKNEITVQYINGTGLYLKGTDTDIGSSLKTLLEYYMGVIPATDIANSEDVHNVNSSLQIGSLESLTSVKIICYSTSLSASDYAYIRSMSGLVTLDLSDAVSNGKKVPSNAFLNMKKLTNVQMSRFDTEWGNSIFAGTKVDEIRLPDSLTTASSATFNNIKYVHTASRYVNYVRDNGRFVFVPDATTFASYNNSSAYYGKIFYDAERYTMDTGDYFLRVDNDTRKAELVAFNSSKYANSYFDVITELNGEAKFDFNTITINGVKYTIKVFGTYSFYGKTFRNVDTAELVIGENVENIEAYAFASVKGFNTLTVKGKSRLEANSFNGITVNTVNFSDDAYIGSYAFRYSTAAKIYAPYVKETGSYSFREMKNLSNAYFPSLRITDEPFYGCANIFRLDIGIFVEGTKFGSLATNTRYTFIHIDETDIADNYDYKLRYTGLNDDNLGSRTVFIPSGFESIYVNYGSEIVLQNADMDNIKEYYDPKDENIVGTVKQPNIYYLDKGDGTAVIVRYLKNAPKSSTDIFAVPKNDGSGENYKITEITEHAYQGTTINAESLTLPDTVTKIGEYAFAGSSKQIGRLNLSNVTYVGRHAFESSKVVIVTGDKVHFMGDMAFASCSSLLYASFNDLSEGAKTDSWGYYFYNCTSLQVACVGPMDEGVRDYIFYGCSALKYVVIDARNRIAGATVPSYLANGTSAKFLVIGTAKGFPNSVNISNDFSNIMLCGTENYSKVLNGVEYSIDVPEAIYIVNTSTKTATLLRYLTKSVEMERYTIPLQIAATGSKVDFHGFQVNECAEHLTAVENGYALTGLSSGAYKGVKFGETIFNTGGYISYLTSGTLSGLQVKYLELENVTEVGQEAFASSTVHTVVANKLVTIGYMAFAHCPNIKEIYLPAVKTMKTWTFWDDKSLESVTLGENLTTIGAGEFADCPNLKEVIFLSPHKNFPDTIFYDYKGYPNKYNTTKEENIQIVVKSEYSAPYIAQWTGKIGSIGVFENSYTDDDTGLTYFYVLVSGNNAELSFFRAPETYKMGSRYEFPSQFTYTDSSSVEHTYTITNIGNMFFAQLGEQSAVETVVLPSGLADLSQNMGSIPNNIRAFEIAESNTTFKTVDGVIYSDDGKTMLFYPKAKTNGEFTIPNDVIFIAEGAFSGNEFLRTVKIDHKVTFAGRAFYGCFVLKNVIITSAELPVFLGTDNFTNCNSEIKITVPNGKAEAFKAAIPFDYKVHQLIVEAPAQP